MYVFFIIIVKVRESANGGCKISKIRVIRFKKLRKIKGATHFWVKINYHLSIKIKRGFLDTSNNLNF